MNRLVPVLLLTLAVAGCTATAPKATADAPSGTATLTCEALTAEVGRAHEAQRAARQKQDDAWKAVVPFAVAGRAMSGKSEAAKATERLDELRARSAQLGCPQT